MNSSLNAMTLARLHQGAYISFETASISPNEAILGVT